MQFCRGVIKVLWSLSKVKHPNLRRILWISMSQLETTYCDHTNTSPDMGTSSVGQMLGAGGWTLDIISYVRSYSFQDADNNMLLIIWGAFSLLLALCCSPGRRVGGGRVAAWLTGRHRLAALVQTDRGEVLPSICKLLSSATNCAGEWSETMALSIIVMWTQTQTKVLWCYFSCETTGLMLKWNKDLHIALDLSQPWSLFAKLPRAGRSGHQLTAFSGFPLLCSGWQLTALPPVHSCTELTQDCPRLASSSLRCSSSGAPSHGPAPWLPASPADDWRPFLPRSLPPAATSVTRHQAVKYSSQPAQPSPAQPSPAQPSTTPSPIVIVTHTSTANHHNHHQEHFTMYNHVMFQPLCEPSHHPGLILICFRECGDNYQWLSKLQQQWSSFNISQWNILFLMKLHVKHWAEVWSGELKGKSYFLIFLFSEPIKICHL